jgi:hypothetical protein
MAYKVLLAIGLAWGFILTLMGLLALLSGYLGPVRDLGKVLLLSAWLWGGPLLLVAGAFWGLRGRHEKASIFLIWVGCFSLTAMVSYQAVSIVQAAADPLIMKPGMVMVAFHIVIVLLALLADATAFRLSWKMK